MRDLSDEVRKFTDDDFRAAVALLERLDFRLDAALQLLRVTDGFRHILLAHCCAHNLSGHKAPEAGPQNAK